MLTRLSTSFLALLLLIGLWGCNPTTTNSTDANNTDSDSSAAGLTVVPASPTGVPVAGEYYEIVVVNDSIKSPRKELSGTIGGADITINYGSPSVNGRTLYGDLVPFQKVWRTGANEAAQITTSADLRFGEDPGKVIPAGTYGLFTLPTDRENWIYIFNQDADQWGTYEYDKGLDVARVMTTSMDAEEFSERMDFSLTENTIQLHWGDLIVPLSVSPAN